MTASPLADQRILDAHTSDEIVYARFGWLVVRAWWQPRQWSRTGEGWWRYTLFVDGIAEHVGANSIREAVRLARENRRFVAQRDGGQR